MSNALAENLIVYCISQDNHEKLRNLIEFSPHNMKNTLQRLFSVNEAFSGNALYDKYNLRSPEIARLLLLGAEFQQKNLLKSASAMKLVSVCSEKYPEVFQEVCEKYSLTKDQLDSVS